MASSKENVTKTFTTTTSGSTQSTSRVKVTKTIQKTLPDGNVITETFTEYKELNDGADFSDFGTIPNQEPLKFKVGTGDLLSKDNKKVKEKVTSSESSSSDDEDNDDDFAKEALKVHNEYRKNHGVKPLKLSKKMCEYAQDWADKLAAEDKFEHRSDCQYGENLYCSWSSNPKAKITGSSPVNSWYSEISKHNFDEEPRGLGTSHFTQVVWKASKKLGIAKARSKGGKFIVVANYDPAGNFVGKYRDNVMPPKA